MEDATVKLQHKLNVISKVESSWSSYQNVVHQKLHHLDKKAFGDIEGVLKATVSANGCIAETVENDTSPEAVQPERELHQSARVNRQVNNSCCMDAIEIQRLMKNYYREHAIQYGKRLLRYFEVQKEQERHSSISSVSTNTSSLEATSTVETALNSVTGNRSSAAKGKLIKELVKRTSFSVDSMADLAVEFKVHCPNGESGIDLEGFHRIVNNYMVQQVMPKHTEMRRGSITSLQEEDLSNEYIIDRLFHIFDSDQNGSIDFREFVIGISGYLNTTVSQKIDMLYEIYDTDRSGTLSLTELAQIVGGGKDKLIQQMKYVQEYLTLIDVDHDNEITEAEFIVAIKRDKVLLDAFMRKADRNPPILDARKVNYSVVVHKDLQLLLDRIGCNWQIMVEFQDACYVKWLTGEKNLIYVDGIEQPIRTISKIEFLDLVFEFLMHAKSTDASLIEKTFQAYSILIEHESSALDWGELSWDLATLVERAKPQSDAMLSKHGMYQAKFYFRFYDVNRDGALSIAELYTATGSTKDTAEIEMANILQAMEASTNDGTLTKAKFARVAEKFPILMQSIHLCL